MFLNYLMSLKTRNTNTSSSNISIFNPKTLNKVNIFLFFFVDFQQIVPGLILKVTNVKIEPFLS